MGQTPPVDRTTNGQPSPGRGSLDAIVDRAALAEAKSGTTVVGGLVGAMWISEAVDTILRHRLDRFGVQPRSIEGLRGIPLAPFLHAGWAHLIGNTVPFAVMGVLVALSGLARFVETFVVILLASGIGMWLFGGSNTVHIGASGIVFGFLGFLIFRGFFARKLGQIALGLIVAVVYGGLIWGVLPTQRGVSWQGHLFGFLGGIAAAALTRRRSNR